MSMEDILYLSLNLSSIDIFDYDSLVKTSLALEQTYH